MRRLLAPDRATITGKGHRSSFEANGRRRSILPAGTILLNTRTHRAASFVRQDPAAIARGVTPEPSPRTIPDIASRNPDLCRRICSLPRRSAQLPTSGSVISLFQSGRAWTTIQCPGISALTYLGLEVREQVRSEFPAVRLPSGLSRMENRGSGVPALWLPTRPCPSSLRRPADQLNRCRSALQMQQLRP